MFFIFVIWQLENMWKSTYFSFEYWCHQLEIGIPTYIKRPLYYIYALSKDAGFLRRNTQQAFQSYKYIYIFFFFAAHLYELIELHWRSLQISFQGTLAWLSKKLNKMCLSWNSTEISKLETFLKELKDEKFVLPLCVTDQWPS